MENMRNYTLGELADIYDQATPEEQQWMLENIREWGKEKKACD